LQLGAVLHGGLESGHGVSEVSLLLGSLLLFGVTPDFRRGTKCISYVRQDQFTHI
jgi:hypothetical protein